VIFIYIDFVSVSCDVSSRFLNCSGSVVLLLFLILLKKQGTAAIQHANECAHICEEVLEDLRLRFSAISIPTTT
jgi:hypothetical protein